MKDKIKYLALPYLLVMLCYTVTCMALCWVVYAMDDQAVPKFREILLHVFLFIIGIFFIIKFIKPTLKLFYSKKTNASFSAQFSYLIFFIMIFIAMSSQGLVHDYTGKLTTLTSISQINLVPPVKYYEISKYWVHKNALRVGRYSKVSGRNNSSYDMYSYLLAPIFANENDTLSHPIAWLGKVQNKTIGNKHSIAIKAQKFTAFEKGNIDDFKKSDFSKILYFKRTDRLNDWEEFSRLLPGFQNPNILLGINKPFSERVNISLHILFWTYFVNIVLTVVVLIFVSVRTTEFELYKSGLQPKLELDEIDSFSIWLKNHLQRYASSQLLAVILLVSLIDYSIFPYINIVFWGANIGPLTIQGQWWRVFTSNFITYDPYQFLFLQVYGMLIFGSLLQKVISKKSIYLLFIGSGIICNIVAIYKYPQNAYFGAIGPTFALCSTLLILIVTQVYQVSILKGLLIGFAIFFFIVFAFTNNIFQQSVVSLPLTGSAIGAFYGAYISLYITREENIT